MDYINVLDCIIGIEELLIDIIINLHLIINLHQGIYWSKMKSKKLNIVRYFYNLK